MSYSIKEVKELLNDIQDLQTLEASEWNQDERKGVQQAISRRKNSWRKKLLWLRIMKR